MSIARLGAWRNLAAWSGTLCLFLMLASLLDGAQAGGRKDPDLHVMLPGQRINLSGNMPRDTSTLADLAISADKPGPRLSLEETYSGFWMGGTLWRAEASTPAGLASGDYTVTLSARNETSPKGMQRFTLRVFQDQAALERASLSLSVRVFGVSPFILAALLLPAGVLCGFASTLLSRRLAQSLRAMGLGQIFRVQRTPDGLLAYFSLGREDGLAEGDAVEFLDPSGARTICSAAVSTLRAADAEALLPKDAPVPISALARRAAKS